MEASRFHRSCSLALDALYAGCCTAHHESSPCLRTAPRQRTRARLSTPTAPDHESSPSTQVMAPGQPAYRFKIYRPPFDESRQAALSKDIMSTQRLQAIAADPMPLVVALHHPPMAIGHPVLDAMSLVDHASLRSLLTPIPSLRAVLFGHIHQHWQGCWPERPDLPVLGCPSTLKSMQHVQPCPSKRSAGWK